MSIHSHKWELINERKTEVYPDYDDDVLIVIYVRCIECDLTVPLPINDIFLKFIMRQSDFNIGMPPDFDLLLLEKSCDELIDNKFDKIKNPCSGGS